MPKTNPTEQKISTYSLPIEASWALKTRKSALNWLETTGLPNKRDEYWKNTDPSYFNSIKKPERNKIDYVEN